MLCDVRTEAEETVELVVCSTTEHSQMAAHKGEVNMCFAPRRNETDDNWPWSNA